jgi:hypothetical protein
MNASSPRGPLPSWGFFSPVRPRVGNNGDDPPHSADQGQSSPPQPPSCSSDPDCSDNLHPPLPPHLFGELGDAEPYDLRATVLAEALVWLNTVDRMGYAAYASSDNVNAFLAAYGIVTGVSEPIRFGAEEYGEWDLKRPAPPEVTHPPREITSSTLQVTDFGDLVIRWLNCGALNSGGNWDPERIDSDLFTIFRFTGTNSTDRRAPQHPSVGDARLVLVHYLIKHGLDFVNGVIGAAKILKICPRSQPEQIIELASELGDAVAILGRESRASPIAKMTYGELYLTLRDVDRRPSIVRSLVAGSLSVLAVSAVFGREQLGAPLPSLVSALVGMAVGAFCASQPSALPMPRFLQRLNDLVPTVSLSADFEGVERNLRMDTAIGGED